MIQYYNTSCYTDEIALKNFKKGEEENKRLYSNQLVELSKIIQNLLIQKQIIIEEYEITKNEQEKKEKQLKKLKITPKNNIEDNSDSNNNNNNNNNNSNNDDDDVNKHFFHSFKNIDAFTQTSSYVSIY